MPVVPIVELGSLFGFVIGYIFPIIPTTLAAWWYVDPLLDFDNFGDITTMVNPPSRQKIKVCGPTTIGDA